MGRATEHQAMERVSIRRLVKTFGPTVALRGVGIDLRPGLTVIEGPNGSGKSTLLRIIGTVLRPTSGTVSYHPLGRDLERVRATTGWLSHEPAAYPDLSGRANVELAAELLGLVPDEAWRRSVERFDLGAFAERPLRTNSRGQRQRIALARALLHDPSLLLLDEPTAGLDPPSVELLREAVRRELDRDAIVVVVSHDPGLFRDVPATFVRLVRGRVRDVRSTVAERA